MATSRLSQSSSRRPSRDRDRNGSCTHLVMTRLWDETGHDKCSLCYRPPVLGWLYRCTQDHNGCLPASDFHMTDNSKRLENDADLYTLSPSVSDAASKGHYTDAELAILWKQKIEVRKLIRQIRPTTSSSISSASSSNYSVPATATYSTLPSTESDTDIEPELEASRYLDCLQACRGPLEPIQEVPIDLEMDHRILPFAKSTLPPLCNFKVCHNCRPNYRERCWVSLNGVLNTPYRQLTPPRHEVHNKRLSDINIVKKLGVSTSSLVPDCNAQHYFRAPIKRNSRTEFQDTVQRLLKDQDPRIVRHSSDNVKENAGRQQFSHHKSYQDLARMVSTSSMDEIDTSFIPSNGDSASFDNGNTTFSSVYESSVIPDDDESASSFLYPRPLYHRRGFERVASIMVPPRSAVSHCGESTSSQALSTSHSISSCPGIVERRSIENGTNGVHNDEKKITKGPSQLQQPPKIVVVDSDLLLPLQSTLAELADADVTSLDRTFDSRSRALVK